MSLTRWSFLNITATKKKNLEGRKLGSGQQHHGESSKDVRF